MSSSSPSSPSSQELGMLSREQLIHLFDRFAFLTSQPDVKRRIKEAVDDNQEAVALTTAIQEEIFTEMGIDPSFGIACLGKVNRVYENDMDLMIQFYRFAAKEELACDEAELEVDEFSRRILSHQKLQEQQLEMLKYMRKLHPSDQSAIFEEAHTPGVVYSLRRQMESSNCNGGAIIFSPEQIQEILQSRAAT